jgi:tRNA(adenine34) deaminase
MSPWTVSDEAFMTLALDLAVKAAHCAEVPVGAVVVRNGKLIGQGHNQPITATDPTAHAEMVALRAAARHDDNYRPNGAELYVTLEPCAMCVGAMIHARIARLVFGAYDSKAGAAGSVLNLSGNRSMNHRIEVNGGLMQEQCGEVLRRFFESRR